MVHLSGRGVLACLYRQYLEPAGALLHPPKRHLHTLKIHGFAERKPDLAPSVIGHEDVGARPPRLDVCAVAVARQRGQAAEGATAGVAAVSTREDIVSSGGDGDRCPGTNLNIPHVVVAGTAGDIALGVALHFQSISAGTGE